MSTISQTPKIKTVRILNNRNLNLFIITALIVAFVAIFTGAVAFTTVKPIDHSAYMLYRQGEWLSVPVHVSNAEAYQIFHRGEVASPLSNAEAYQLFRKGEVPSMLTNAEAYQLFRRGEWASVIPVVDMTAYHLSERMLIDPRAGLTVYLLSERTLVDPRAALATYFNSERTSIPVLFTAYQRSEWFGK